MAFHLCSYLLVTPLSLVTVEGNLSILYFFCLSVGSVAYEKLCSALTNVNLIKAIKQASPFAQTSCLEGFHSVLNHFAPKMIASRTKRADLQQICIRSVLTETDQLQTTLSSAESVFSLLQTLSLNTLRDVNTADAKPTNNRSADYLQRLQMICNTLKPKNRYYR